MLGLIDDLVRAFTGGSQVQPITDTDPTAQAATAASAQAGQQIQQQQQQQGGQGGQAQPQPQPQQPQQPQLPAPMKSPIEPQPGFLQQHPGIGNSLQFLLPALMGLGQAMQVPKLAGPGAKVGAGLSAGAGAFMQMQMMQSQNALRAALLQKQIQHMNTMEALSGQKNATAEERNRLQFGSAGFDITAQMRQQDPNNPIWKTLPPNMSDLPVKQQTQLLQMASTNALRQQTAEQLYDTKLQGLQIQRQGLQERVESMNMMHQAAEDRIAMMGKLGEDNVAIRQQLADARDQANKIEQEKAKIMERQKELDRETKTSLEEIKAKLKSHEIYDRQGILAKWVYGESLDDIQKNMALPTGGAGTPGAGSTGSTSPIEP